MRPASSISVSRLGRCAAALALAAPHALLAAPADCSATADPLACRMGQWLSWLHFAAAVLGVLLLAVVVICVRVVRRNRKSADLLDSLSRKERPR